jgi:hypothetical protein
LHIYLFFELLTILCHGYTGTIRKPEVAIKPVDSHLSYGLSIPTVLATPCKHLGQPLIFGEIPFMSASTQDVKRITTHTLQRMKAAGTKISMLTAYDYSFASLFDAAGIDVILVGDSASNVMAGHETTLPITLDQMIIMHRRSFGVQNVAWWWLTSPLALTKATATLHGVSHPHYERNRCPCH